MNSDTKQMYDSAVDNLLDGIGNSYANWNKALDSPNTDRVNEFRNRLKINPGRKFDKVIENRRVWGFVAKAAGWSAPAKWQRGSIFDTNTDWFSWTGPNYL